MSHAPHVCCSIAHDVEVAILLLGFPPDCVPVAIYSGMPSGGGARGETDSLLLRRHTYLHMRTHACGLLWIAGIL